MLAIIITAAVITSSAIAATPLDYKMLSCTYNFETSSIVLNTNCKTNCRVSFRMGDVRSRVFIKSVDKPNDLNDYIVMEQDGPGQTYRMTFPIKCSTTTDITISQQ